MENECFMKVITVSSHSVVYCCIYSLYKMFRLHVDLELHVHVQVFELCSNSFFSQCEGGHHFASFLFVLQGGSGGTCTSQVVLIKLSKKRSFLKITYMYLLR